MKVHLRVDPALDEALVDLLAVPGPVRLRAQRAAAVLAENSFATLVIKMISRMRMRRRKRRRRRRKRRKWRRKKTSDRVWSSREVMPTICCD